MPRRETELVSFRLDRALIAKIDEWARSRGGTRTDGTRDLLERGLASVTPAPTAATKPPTDGSPRARAVAAAEAECAWCGPPRSGPHHERCPHSPGSGLGAAFRELRR